MKRRIVIALDKACELTHRVRVRNCRLAELSCDLDERWGTGVWTRAGQDDIREQMSEVAA